MRTLIVRVIRIQAAEHQIAVTALDRGMDELPVFPGQGESDVKTEDLGVEANRGVDVRYGQGRDDVFHFLICSFFMSSGVSPSQPTAK
jgi:hypothetical protein